MEWSIKHLASAAGTTSRALRHYEALGLLAPSRIAANGYRYYDEAALVRLQRILLLRGLGLGLKAIGDVLDGERDTAAALRTHLVQLERERERIGRQIAAVRTTLDKTERGARLAADEVFDGFDHAQHAQEVTERWGREAWERGDRWWRSLDDAEKRAFQQEQAEIAAAYAAAHRAGRTPDSDAVQAIARRHHDWLSITTKPTRAYLTGLGEMYVADPRFRAHYDRDEPGTAELARAALGVYAERNLR